MRTIYIIVEKISDCDNDRFSDELDSDDNHGDVEYARLCATTHQYNVYYYSDANKRKHHALLEQYVPDNDMEVSVSVRSVEFEFGSDALPDRYFLPLLAHLNCHKQGITTVPSAVDRAQTLYERVLSNFKIAQEKKSALLMGLHKLSSTSQSGLWSREARDEVLKTIFQYANLS